MTMIVIMKTEVLHTEAIEGPTMPFVDSPLRAKNDAALRSYDYHTEVYRSYFTSPFDQYAERIGQHFTVVRRLEDAESNDDEPGEDMYLIRFDDGVEIEAWGHEVCILKYENCE